MALQIQADRQAVADAQLIAAKGDPLASAPKPRNRGRPLGSKTRNTGDLTGEPSDSAGQAAMRMLENRKLSSKVNYNVLADLFSDPEPASGERRAHLSRKRGWVGGWVCQVIWQQVYL